MIKGFKTFKPQIHSLAVVAENSTIIGNVEVGKACSIWYGVVLRDDESLIQMGDESK